MQSLTIIGNLGADAELRGVDGAQFVTFKVADTVKFTNNKGQVQETTTWVSCILNGDGGNLLPYLKKGVKVCCIGRPSYRVYGSEKLRQMMAGVDLRIMNIELCGGSAEEIPSTLVDKDGALHKVQRLYKIPINEAVIVEQLMSVNGGTLYDVDPEGFVTKHIDDI